MASINTDVMKQLLDEFSEKQALCSEEINAIEQQIIELQQRIPMLHEKLSVVSQDRTKIEEMMNRYAGSHHAVLHAAQPRMTLVKPAIVEQIQQEAPIAVGQTQGQGIDRVAAARLRA